MRYLFGFLCVCALGLMPLVGCSETAGTGGSGGGVGGDGGTGGMAECQDPEDCDDREECTTDDCSEGTCEYTPVADSTACAENNECTAGQCAEGVCEATPLANGTPCGDNADTCQDGHCVADCEGSVCPCSEAGIRGAIAEGGGPFTFDCDDSQIVVTDAEIVIDNDVVLDGEGNLTVDGDDDHVVFNVPEGTTAELRGLVVTNGRSVPFGCIVNDGDLTLTNSTVSRCSSEGDETGMVQAGPSAISNEGALTLVDSEVVENDGIPLGNGAGRSMTLVRTTVSRNAEGGIFNGDGSLVVIDSTVSDNGGTEAGIGVDGDDGSLVLTNSTVSGNGRGVGASGSSLMLVNSTVIGDVGQPSADGTLNVTGSVIVGACVDMLVTSDGYNIESPGDTCGFDHGTDLVNITEGQLELGDLANNGGPTMTHALGADSVAIDHIPAVDCGVTTDQRGEPRPVGEGCDVGSFERQPEDP